MLSCTRILEQPLKLIAKNETTNPNEIIRIKCWMFVPSIGPPYRNRAKLQFKKLKEKIMMRIEPAFINSRFTTC